VNGTYPVSLSAEMKSEELPLPKNRQGMGTMTYINAAGRMCKEFRSGQGQKSQDIAGFAKRANRSAGGHQSRNQ
jgi:hypothetical protein